MSELYSALGNTEYGETLEGNVRFERFKPEWLENWMWGEMLGNDVNNYRHMKYTAGITAWYIFEAERLGQPFSYPEQEILMLTAFTHDFAEAIDGDVPDPEKKDDELTKRQERNSYYLVASSVTGYAQQLGEIVIPVIQGRDKLSRDFRAIELIGYIETGKKAEYLSHHLGEVQRKYDFDYAQLKDLWNCLHDLSTAVQFHDVSKLERDFSDLPVVRSYLDEKES